MTLLRNFLTLVLAALLTTSAFAEPVSGRYGSLNLAVSSGRISGIFSEGRIGNGSGEAWQFTCIFLLRGILGGQSATVETWFPGMSERIAGVLRFDRDGVSLQLDENHGGCPMTTGDMVDSPFPLSATEQRGDWLDLGLVTQERAVLQSDAAEDPDRRRPYLVEFDTIAVLERRDGWALVEYLDGETPSTGWLRSSQIATARTDP